MVYWPLAVSGLCGLLLFAVVAALIFKPDFRADLVAGQGKASLFGVLSVEGVVIVILCGMFLTGLLYPGWRNGGELAYADDAQQQIRVLTEKLATAEANVRSLTNDTRTRFTIEDVPQVLANLAPENEISEEIRELSDSNKGPWSPFARSQEILVSIPGGQR